MKQVPSTKHPLWNSWRYIQDSLAHYPTRDGITAKKLNLDCDWTRFQDFRDDLEAHLGLPKKNQQLVRKNMKVGWRLNNLHYATRKQKGGLQRRCLFVKYRGKTYCAKHLCYEKGKVSYASFLSRLERGWSVKDALLPAYAKR